MSQSPGRPRWLLRSSGQLQRHSDILVIVEKQRRGAEQKKTCVKMVFRAFRRWAPGTDARRGGSPSGEARQRFPPRPSCLRRTRAPRRSGAWPGRRPPAPGRNAAFPRPADPARGRSMRRLLPANAPEVNVPVQTGVWEVGSRPPCVERSVGGGGRPPAVLPGPAGWESRPAGQRSVRGRALRAQGAPLGAGASARGAFSEV